MNLLVTLTPKIFPTTIVSPIDTDSKLAIKASAGFSFAWIRVDNR